MDCLFCSIADKSVPAKIIYEDEFTISFLDINQRTLGHSVVIPKRHRKTILELEESELAPILEAVRKVEKMLQGSIKPEGFTIGINQGKASGQEVDHLHIHIFPRFNGDNGKSVQAIVDNPPEESLDQIIEKIKKSI